MEMWMFGFLVLSGLCDVGCASSQFFYKTISTTWLEAQQYCRRNQGDLATVSDLQDLEKLAGLIEDSNPVVFLGLGRQWAWSVSDGDGYREGEPAYWNWADDNEPSGEACGTVGLSGKWFSSSCSSLMDFFCYSASSANISGRFYLEERSMNWSDAQAFCRRRYTDLAWVRNEQENQALQDVSNNRTVWIGLSRKSWGWSDGSEATFVPWKTSPLPYGDCGALDVRSNTPGIIQTNCAGSAPFLCSRGPLRKQWLRLKPIADSFIQDPEMTKSLLKLIEMRLREAGVSEDVKLSWWKRPEKEDEMEQTAQGHQPCLLNHSSVPFS